MASRQGPLKTLLNRYKFDAARGAADVIVELLDARLPVLPSELLVTAVPTAPANRRIRGFDHMERIAKQLARRRGLEFRATLVQTSNDVQHFKTRKERLAVSGIEPLSTRLLPENILLIDDIFTTGATVQSCVSCLQEKGVQNIYLAIIARQPLDETRDLW